MQYKITTLSAGKQEFAGSEEGIVRAISHAVDMCECDISNSEHKKKEHRIYVNELSATDTLAPKGAIAKVSFSFSTVARSSKTYWIFEEKHEPYGKDWEDPHDTWARPING